MIKLSDIALFINSDLTLVVTPFDSSVVYTLFIMIFIYVVIHLELDDNSSNL